MNQQFPPLLERAARGELDGWSQSPQSRLALIIVLDQFSRTIDRGTAQAFAQDPKALGLAVEEIEVGHYAALETPWEETLPFLSPWPLRGSHKTGTGGQARGHRAIIERFGRHSHRNEVWGGNQRPWNSTILQRANSSTPGRCQASRKLIIERLTEIHR
ncbi:MAG: DUF924 family protein [Candidatus Binatia bacterium]